MYIDNENFEKWMEKLSKKLTENRIQIVVNEKIIKPFCLMFIRSFTGFFVNCIL